MSLRQSGINPLGYLGVEPVTVSADVSFPRDPTSTDSQNFQIMTRWLNTQNQTIWILVSLAGGIATWVMISTGVPGTLDTITGDSGGAISPDVSGNITITGGGGLGSGDGGFFTGSNISHSLTLSFNYLNLPFPTAGGNGIIYSQYPVRYVTPYGTSATFVGNNAGNLTHTGAANTGIGHLAIVNLTSGTDNTGIGAVSLETLTSGSRNNAHGSGALFSLTTGTDNVAVGYQAGFSYMGAESSNILLTNTGTLGESNTIRIGTQGAGTGQQNRAFMAGVYNVTPSGSPIPVVINSSGQLGTGGGAVFSAINTQVFTSSGTYTPTAGMQYCIIEVVGAGGGGAGAVNPGGPGNGSCGMGGGAGGYARKTVTAATIGGSQAVTIGAGGAGGANTGSNGVAGGTSSVGAIVSATGGDFGLGTGAFGSGWIFAAATDGTGGTGVGGDVNTQGNSGDIGFGLGSTFTLGGRGGASIFGGSLKTNSCAGSVANGFAGATYGAGGSGAACQGLNAGGAVGGAGANGIVIITEFIN